MSLIVARKEGSQIAIVSDTKLTYPHHEIKGQKENPTEGAIKTIILTDDLCVSFAGEIEYAENAFMEIGERKNIDEVIGILHRYHNISNQKTEFLVCSGNPESLIHKIKNGESKEVNSSWIGDSVAFNSFQASMLGTKKPKESVKTSQSQSKAGIVITEMNLSFEVDMQVQLFSKMSSAMDKVIEDGNVDSVGGFRVTVVYKEKFDFVKYGKFYRGNVELFGSGSHLIAHGSANEGAYSINFIGASSDHKTVALHVRQGNFGLVYTRNNSGLLRPKLLPQDEVDFIDYVKDKYDLIAAFATQDRIQKYIIDGKSAFDKKDFLKAKDTFDKGLAEATGKKKAELLFYKGICLLNLRDIPNAMQVFQQAINIDNLYQQKVMQVLSQRR
jgi:hypothetical protein